jgi:hypothetical protein
MKKSRQSKTEATTFAKIRGSSSLEEVIAARSLEIGISGLSRPASRATNSPGPGKVLSKIPSSSFTTPPRMPTPVTISRTPTPSLLSPIGSDPSHKIARLSKRFDELTSKLASLEQRADSSLHVPTTAEEAPDFASMRAMSHPILSAAIQSEFGAPSDALRGQRLQDELKEIIERVSGTIKGLNTLFTEVTAKELGAATRLSRVYRGHLTRRKVRAA